MSERRPHWDAELLDAVGRSMHAFYDRPDAMHVYAVIAAVEDWARWEHVPKGTLRRLEQAEAAIARVRERAGGPIPAVHGDWMAGYAAAMRDILSALDGERDE